VILGLFCLFLIGGSLLNLPVPVIGKIAGLDLIVLVMALLGWWQSRSLTAAKLPRVVWAIGLFVLFALVSLIGSGRWLAGQDMAISGLFLARWVVYAGLFFWAYLLNREQRGQTLHWLGLALGIIALLGLMQLILFPNLGFWERLGWDPHQQRLISTFLDPNLVGGFLVVGLALPMSQWLHKTTPRRWKQIWGGVIILMLMAVIFTYSRSALLSLVVFGLIVGVRYWRLALVGLLLMGLVVLASPRLQTRIVGMFEVDITAQQRLTSWQNALNIIKQEPLLGVGYNTLPYTKAKFIYQPVGHAYSGFDSSLLTIAVTTGVLGLATYLGMLGLLLAGLVKFVRDKRSILALGALASTMALFAHSFFVNSWLYPPVLALWWVLLGLVWNNNSADD